MEAISPTGPEAPGDHTDDLKAVKDELLMKITKVDREIAKTESQIAKLKKKYVRTLENTLLIGFCYFPSSVCDQHLVIILCHIYLI